MAANSLFFNVLVQISLPKSNGRVILAFFFQVARLSAKYGIRIERIKEGRYVVDGKINIFVRVG